MKVAFSVAVIMGFLISGAVHAQSMCDQLRANIEIARQTLDDQSAVASARRIYEDSCSGSSTSRRSRRDEGEDEYERALKNAYMPVDGSYVWIKSDGEPFLKCDVNKESCCGSPAEPRSILSISLAGSKKLVSDTTTKLERKEIQNPDVWGRFIWKERSRIAYFERLRDQFCNQAAPVVQASAPASVTEPAETFAEGPRSEIINHPDIIRADQCLRLQDFKRLGPEDTEGSGGYTRRNTCSFTISTATCIKQRRDGIHANGDSWHCREIVLEPGKSEYTGLGTAEIVGNRVTHRSFSCRTESALNPCVRATSEFVRGTRALR